MAEPRADAWRFWVSADYALAWLKSKALPPLATTSPPGTPQGAAGVLGMIGTTTLLGDRAITEKARSLGRLDFGGWFGDDKRFGAAAGFFLTESKGRAFNATSDGTTIIARPFTDATTNTPSSVLVAFPGVSSGSVNVFAAMETFWGAYLDLREAVVDEPWFRLEALFGYRYLHYGENLTMAQTVNATGGAFIPGTALLSTDSFQTINDFHGVEYGFRTEFTRGPWSLDILTKMAAGYIRRETVINGSTLTSVPGTPTTTGVGGVYALSSNIGSHFDNAWVVAPELGLDIGYQLTPNVRLRAGYSLLFLQGVGRAADQIDFTINPNLFPPAIGGAPNRPAFNFVKSDIWIQSVNVGVEFRF
jgi:hypothetical protein